MHPKKNFAFPSRGMMCKVIGESTLHRKGALVKHHIPLVSRRKGNKSLRMGTDLQPNCLLAMSPTRQTKSLTPTLDLSFKAGICLKTSPIPSSNSHDQWICEESYWKQSGFFCL